MSQLVLCLGCTRHVRVDDPCCPFCGGTARGPTVAPRRVAGLGRAALMALGTSVVACGPGETTTVEVVPPSAPIEAASDPVEVVEPVEPVEVVEPVEPTEPPPQPRVRDRIGAPVPAYGGPPPAPVTPEPRPRPSRPPEADNGGNVPLYGGPGLD